MAEQLRYLLTGDPQLLQPFNAGRLETNHLYRQLETLLADRDEARKLVQLEPLWVL